ncbi:MAG: hypothetical protein AMJ54_06890 [Deltaproteobacteria bacterium SG8_13]|nr:MAG: hypothetical protein AMJ54_06890 [Deltaproteobacteria bacterium SG8_13]
MAKIVDLQSYRSRQIAERVFGPWKKRFGESYGEQTLLEDLSHATLFRLAQPGDESTAAFYELVMGALDLGPAEKFYYLDKAEQLRIVDLHLFLADQVRYELMRRLGWVKEFAVQKLAFMELIERIDQLKLHNRQDPPKLAETHPDFAHFSELNDLDKESFVRRLLPQALEEFRKKL